MRATLGENTVSRRVREVRTYAARPGGRLLSLEAVHEGDGGDVTIAVLFDAKGGHATRTPKGGAPEHLELPPTRDVVENADLVRLAAARHRRLKGYLFDSTTLKDKSEAVADLGPGVLRAGGGRAKVERLSITEDEGKISATTAIGLKDGRILETRFGGALLAVPEPEALAKKLDSVDLFALTRVAVDQPLPTGEVPETVVYEVKGLPENLRPDSNRQSYRALTDGAVALTVRASFPTTSAIRPLSQPATELAATPAIESAAPEIRNLAAEVVGDERDAYSAAKKLSRWVYGHLHKAYGVSSDRATDVLRRRTGDCTEHSLLLAALARAAGIPARLVYGLVYSQGSDGKPGSFWHEWVRDLRGRLDRHRSHLRPGRRRCDAPAARQGRSDRRGSADGSAQDQRAVDEPRVSGAGDSACRLNWESWITWPSR